MSARELEAKVLIGIEVAKAGEALGDVSGGK